MLCLSCKVNESNILSLPAVFSDNMVLQQKSEVAIWGKSSPGNKIRLISSWNEQAETKTRDDGSWSAKLKTPEAGGPYELKIMDKDKAILINNIMIGEVWICSGQSNMEMIMQGFSSADSVLYATEEIRAADYPEIRMFTVSKAVSGEPEYDCKGSWTVCSPETAGAFSAVGFFFGKRLHEEIDVPVGLIHSSWGGTPVEAWIAGKYLENNKDFKDIVNKIRNMLPEYDKFNRWLLEHERIDVSKLDSDDPYVDLDLQDQICSSPDFNDSSWKKIILPDYWENTEIGFFDGAVWFRKKVNIPQSWIGKDLIIKVGTIDDIDAVWINGKKVGGYETEGYWDKLREYEIGENIVKAGENVIAVRVIDLQGGGGIYGEKSEMQLFVKNGNKDEIIYISGEWSYMAVAEYADNVFYLFNVNENEYNNRPVLEVELSSLTPTMLYNAMISPLIPYTIKGAIWYQGESNVDRAKQYEQIFPLMIKNWRDDWKLGDFPFYFVQIAPYEYSGVEGTESAELRDAQRRTLVVPDTGMAVTLDIGNLQNIHPANKKDVGKRLALWALAKDYGQDIVYSGPLYKSMEVEGNKIRVFFDYADNGLKASGKRLTGFEIAGEDGIFIQAVAEINKNQVIVYNPKIREPVYVRYAYHNGSEATLFNAEGLPASSFTTEKELP